MAENRNHSMKDYLVAFFIGDRVIRRVLSEAVNKKEDPIFLKLMGLPSGFSLPFHIEEGRDSAQCHIVLPDTENYQLYVKGKIAYNHIISHGDYITVKNGEAHIFSALFMDLGNIALGYRKYILEQNRNITIGRMPTNDISFELTDYISREKHAVLRTDSDGNCFIENLKRTIGVYVNGKRVNSEKLAVMDEIYIMGLSMIYMGSYIAISNMSCSCSLSAIQSISAKEPEDKDKEEEYFVSTPRILKSLEKEEIEVDAPPAPPMEDKTPAILVLGPSITMAIVMLTSLSVSVISAIQGGNTLSLITSGTMAVGMLMGSLLWPTLLRRYQKKARKKAELHRKEKYTKYISEIEDKLIAKTERTSRILNESLSPSPDILTSFLDDEDKKLHLWERSQEDADFLDVRMGIGTRTFDVVDLKIPRKGFQLFDDELRDLPDALLKKYGMISNVPLTLDLKKNHSVGIIGDYEKINTILSEMILNVISLHAYDEVKLVFIVSPEKAEKYKLFKNLPHVWSDDKTIRYFAENKDEVHFVFNSIDELIKGRETSESRNVDLTPYYCVIITDPYLIEKEAFCRYLENADNTVGVTAVFAYGDIKKLPKSCKTIIQCDDDRTGYYSKNKNANRFIPFRLDKVDNSELQKFAGKLSRLPVRRSARKMGIVDRISFLQMYKAGNVNELNIESHWESNNSAKSLAAPIGAMAGGEVFKLDIHEAYHGCHGLVAGTTGSGKSEFLQAFVLSLAINYSPNEIAFVLVDFKGGDMARPFMEKAFSPALPHLAATISNLSGNVLYRALVSFEAEIKYRQSLFNTAASMLEVDKLDINSYHKYFKAGRLSTPLPHLVIIIDEFAQLKTQHPEFLTQLINVAQVGRSLGIHLILATQKPGGIVDPQIMSNSRFKVCLKVAEKQDSMDMINRPDAAMIKNPGRLYLQVGYNEIYECMQSGYSGAEYIPTDTYVSDDEVSVQLIDNTANTVSSARIDNSADKSDKTQLEAIVSEIVSLGEKKNLRVKPLWMDMLKDKIGLNSLEQGKRGLCTAAVGLLDLVKTQEQKTFFLDFVRNGHVGIYGASGSGKTTFLQTLVYSMVCGYGYSPEELNIYALDFGGRNLSYLKRLPHTGGVVFADEENKISSLTDILHTCLEERKSLFAANNCSSFAEYRSVAKTALPAILVLIDNYSILHDRYLEIEEQLLEIISAGKTFGIFFVITGSTRNAIYYKTIEHISTFIALRMNDANSYLDILNTRPAIVPEEIAGRGITVINKTVVEFQTALAAVTETEADRLKIITDQYESIRRKWKGSMPMSIESGRRTSYSVPQTTAAVSPASSMRNDTPDALPDEEENLLLALSKSGVVSYGLKTSSDQSLCICASSENDFAACYQGILNLITVYPQRNIIFIDRPERQYESLIRSFNTCRYIGSAEEFETFTEDLKPELNARLENEEARKKQMILIIAEFNSFFEMITDEQAALMRKVFQYIDSPDYGITFICGFNVNGEKNNDRLFLSLVVNAKNYIICADSYEAAQQKIETMPIIYSIRNSSSYICLHGRVAEIRW